jgi:hypothetical protein
VNTQTQLREYFSYVDEQQGAVDVRTIVEADDRVVRTVPPKPRRRIPVLAWAAVAAALIAAVLLPLLFFDDPIDTDVVTTVPDVTVPEIPETTGPDARSGDIELLPAASAAGWEWVETDLPAIAGFDIRHLPDGTWAAYHIGWQCATGEGDELTLYFNDGSDNAENQAGCAGVPVADPEEQLWVSMDGRSWTEAGVPFGEGTFTRTRGLTDRLIVNTQTPGCGPGASVGGCWLEYVDGAWQEPLQDGQFDVVASAAWEGPMLRGLDATLIVGQSPETGEILEIWVQQPTDGSPSVSWEPGYRVPAGCTIDGPGPCGGHEIDGVVYRTDAVQGSYFFLRDEWHRIDWFDPEGVQLSSTGDAGAFLSSGSVSGLPSGETYAKGTLLVEVVGEAVVVTGSHSSAFGPGANDFFVSFDGLVWEPLDVPRSFGGFPDVVYLVSIDDWLIVAAHELVLGTPDLEHWFRFDVPTGTEDRLALGWVFAHADRVTAWARESRDEPYSYWVAIPPGS